MRGKGQRKTGEGNAVRAGESEAIEPFTPHPRPSSLVGRPSVCACALCLARSGDKGDIANIGVIARSDAIYAWMVEHLTPAFVKRYFDDVCEGEVERFELPNLLAVNFLLHRSLGGGGTLSLLLDAQGKTYAQFLLAATVEVPESLLELRAARSEGAPATHDENRDAHQQEQPHV